jgi:hypothetical protein
MPTWNVMVSVHQSATHPTPQSLDTDSVVLYPKYGRSLCCMGTVSWTLLLILILKIICRIHRPLKPVSVHHHTTLLSCVAPSSHAVSAFPYIVSYPTGLIYFTFDLKHFQNQGKQPRWNRNSALRPALSPDISVPLYDTVLLLSPAVTPCVTLLQWNESNERQILLRNMDFDASGFYSCEVSTQTPIYTKPSNDHELTVIRKCTFRAGCGCN